MLSVPEPLPNDPEAVVTALETAEIFGKQGDVKEAVRWVRRAAEIAGDEGIDERALTLARAVADLNISASQPPQAQAEAAPAPAPQAPAPQAAAPQAPPPPPLPAAGATSYDPDGDAETRVVDSTHLLEEYEKQTNGNGAARLPPPSLSAVATPVATPAEMVAAVHAMNAEEPPTSPTAPANEPPPPVPPAPALASVDTAPDPAASERALDAEESTPPSRRPVSSMAELLARKEAEVSSAIAAAEAVQPAESGWDDPPPPPPPPPQHSTPPAERRTAHPVADRVTTPLIPSQPYLERPPVNAPIYQAVRASIVATAEPGVFVMRMLAADQSPAPTGHEVLVVTTNPNSSPFK
ncbi:MAG TPA: hypothetical protein VFZ53_18190 [Polyangiaceae bacterium]